LLLVGALARSWGARPCDHGKVVWAEVPLTDQTGSAAATR
jgi:hypothetical protein